MTTREKMTDIRIRNSYTMKDLAAKCKCSESLLGMIESGDVTHPRIVKRIAKVYSLTNLEAEELLPINYRKHGGEYDPDRYKDMFAANRKKFSIKRMSTGLSPNKLKMV